MVFSPGERQAVERLGRRWFGRPLRRWRCASLAGAPDWGRVEIGYWRGGLTLELDDPVEAVFHGVFHLYRDGSDLLLHNDGLRIRGRHRRRGLGTQMFRRQLLAAAALGVARIELTAGRDADENGYYTWPRFGFDAPLPGDLRERLPAGLEAARRVLDLIETGRGRAWWREHGGPLHGVFDLRPRSRSRRVFRRYVRSRRPVRPP